MTSFLLQITSFYIFAILQMSDFTTLIEKLGIPVAFSIFMFLYFKGTIDKSNSERVEMSKQMIMLMETNNTYLQTLVKDSMSEIKCKYK